MNSASFWLVIAIAFVCFKSDSKAQQSSNLSLDDVVVGIKEFETRIVGLESLLVDYQILPAEHLISNLDSTSYIGNARFVVGWKGDNWYCESKKSSNPDLFDYDRIFVLNGKNGVEFTHRKLDADNLCLGKQGMTSDAYDSWTYTDNLFLNIYKSLPKSVRADFSQLLLDNNPCDSPAKYLFLPSAIEQNRSEYSVLEESFGGVDCVVLERKGSDRIWLAPEYGFAVMKREMYYRDDRPRKTLWRVVINSKFRDFENGIKLPMKQVIVDYPDPEFEGSKVWGKPGCKRTIVVNKIRLNSLDESFFEPKVSNGTFVQDFINDIEYRIRDSSKTPFEDLLSGAASGQNISAIRWRRRGIVGLAFLTLVGVGFLTLMKRKSGK